MNKRVKFSLLLASTALSLPLISASQPASAAQAGSPELPVITVTAERRAMTLQDTPISIVAFTTESMELQGIEDLQDLSRFAPNLSIQGSRGSGNNQPTFMIRGIAGGNGGLGERGVGLYLDGIYIPRTNGSIFKVLDMERVEVLRGPQGTLFGRNSTGGAIRMFTKQPSSEYEGYVKVTGGNFDRHDIAAMVNVPVNEQLAFRFQGGYLNEDGYVRRGTQMLGGYEDWVGHAQAKYTPTSNLSITVGFLYSDSKSDGSPQDVVTFDMRPGIEGIVQGNYADWLSDAFKADGQAPIAAYNDPRIVLDDFTMPDICLIDDFNPDWSDACKLSNNSKYTQADANIEWQLNDNWTLSSITGYAEMNHKGITSWQQLGFEIRPDNNKSKVMSQEFQLNASLFDSKVDVVTGANYFHENSYSYGSNITRRGTSTYSPAGGSANGDGDAGLFITNDINTTQKSTSFGVFGNATWHLTDQLNLTGGLRFAYDKKYLTTTANASANFIPLSGTSTTATNRDHWTALDWRGTVDYHFTKEFMIYATASKAYRAGAMTPTTARVPATLTTPAYTSYAVGSVPPEKVVNLEAGARTEWLGGRLRINPTFFYMFWTNRQAARQVSCASEGPVACPIGFRIQIVNSGDVDTYGFEFDTQFAITDNLSIQGTAGITDYKLKDPVANSGPYLFPDPASPSFAVGAVYNLPINGVGDVGFSANWTYVGSQQTHPTDTGDSTYKQPGYGLVNAQIRWTTEDKRVGLTFFVNNLLDKTYASYSTRFGGGYWDQGGPGFGVGAAPRSSLNVVRGRPREWGLQLGYNF